MELLSGNTADWSVVAKNVSFINNLLNLDISNIQEGTGATKMAEPSGLAIGDIWRSGATGTSQALNVKTS